MRTKSFPRFFRAWVIVGSAVALLLGYGVTVAEATNHCDATSITLGQEKLGNIFVSGENVAFPVENATGEEVRWTARDFWNREVAQGTEPLVGGQANIQVNPGALGYFTLDLASYDAGAVTGCKRTRFAVLAPFTRPASSRYGVQTHFGTLGNPYPLEVIPLMQRLGVTFTRDSVRWEHVEQERGVFTFDPWFDTYIDALDAADLSPMLVFGLYNNLYDNGDTPYTEEGLDAYGEYARQIVQRYGSRMIAGEVWNEPNGTGFTKGPAAGDPVNYAQMVQHVNEAVKPGNPSMPVVLGATTGIDLPWLEQVFQAGGLDFADRVSVHHYPVRATSNEDDIPALQGLVDQYSGGRNVPTWITETGWPTRHPRDEVMVARDLVKLLALESVHGPTRISWFNLIHNAEQFGLLRSEQDELGRFVPKPAYVAYAVLTRQLSTATPQGKTGIPGVRSYLFDKNGTQLRVLWAEDGNKVVQLSGSGSVHVTDFMGNTTTYSSPPTLALTDEPVYVEGNLTDMTVVSSEYEAEALPATVAPGTTREQFSDPNLSGGAGDKYNGTQPGDFIDYQVDVPAAGSYDIVARLKTHESRGIYQLAVNGVNQGPPIDAYSAGDGYRLVFPGRKHFSSAGNASFRLTVTGKNPAATGYTFATDYIELIPANPTGGLRSEAEGLVATVTGGTTREQFFEAGLSSNHADKYNGAGVGDEITYFDIEVPAPGAYEIVVRAKTFNNRGIYQLAIENGNQGQPFDSYHPETFNRHYSLGTRIMNSAGKKRFAFTVVGKHADSTGYTLALDYIELIPINT